MSTRTKDEERELARRVTRSLSRVLDTLGTPESDEAKRAANRDMAAIFSFPVPPTRRGKS